jgi:hypothetical protein
MSKSAIDVVYGTSAKWGFPNQIALAAILTISATSAVL